MSPRSDDPIPTSRFASVNLVEALSTAQDMPVEALELAIRAPARLAGPVLAVLDKAAGGAALDEREGNLLFWGIHVLGHARDTRLHGPLLRIVRRAPDDVAELIGPTVAGTLPRLVASSFGDDPEPLEAAILDRDADEFVRWSLFGAYAFLTAEDRIARDRAHALLSGFDVNRPARAGDAAWTGWEQAIALLGFADLADRVAAARDDARLLDDVSDPQWFALTLAEAQAGPQDRARFEDLGLGYVVDVVAELEDALAEEDDEEDPEPLEPLRNPFRDVGRNDPCPCGSGKKFKACCLAVS